MYKFKFQKIYRVKIYIDIFDKIFEKQEKNFKVDKLFSKFAR